MTLNQSTANKAHPVRDGGSRTQVAKVAVVNSISNLSVVAAPLWVGLAPEHFGLPTWAGGAIASVQLFAAAGSNVLFSHLLTRFNRRTASSALLALAALGYLVATLPNAAVFAAGTVVAGAALGALGALVFSTAATSANPHRMFNTLTAVQILLVTLFYAVAPRLLSSLGFAGLFGFMSLLCASSLTLVSAFPKLRGTQASDEMRREPLSNRTAGLLGLIGFVLLLAGYMGVVSYAGLFGGRFRLSAASVGYALAMASLVSIAGPIVGGFLGERFGSFKPACAAIVALSVSIAILALAKAPALYYAAIILLFTSLVFGIPYVMALLASLDGEGRWIASGPAAIMVGSAVGPAAGAAVLAAGLDASSLALVAVVSLLGSSLLLSRVARTSHG